MTTVAGDPACPAAGVGLDDEPAYDTFGVVGSTPGSSRNRQSTRRHEGYSFGKLDSDRFII